MIVGKNFKKSNCQFLNGLSSFNGLEMTGIWKWYPTLQQHVYFQFFRFAYVEQYFQPKSLNLINLWDTWKEFEKI